LKEYYLSTIQSVTSAQLLKFKKNFCFTVFKKFKKKKMFTLLTVVSTVLRKISAQRACIEIQTKLSNAFDSGNYATLASLDLTAAFDVVDRKLLKFF
jgi:predicted negative regulator of RcsB-dependent stress response